MSIWKILAIIVFILPFISITLVLTLKLDVWWYDMNQWFTIICGLVMGAFIIIGNLTDKK